MDTGMTRMDDDNLPSAEAMVAGTLALMTGHAQASCEKERRLMSAKVIDNLGQLAEHPGLSLLFRAALCSLRTHWQAMQVQPAADAAANDRWMLHPVPALFQ